MINKVWKDPVWSKIIATGILALIGFISAYFLNWWPRIKGAISYSIEFVYATTALSNWLLGIMALCTMIVIFVLAMMLKGKILPESQSVDWKNYTSDTFFGLEWHWKYGSGSSIYNLFSCCMKCHYQIFPKEALLSYSFYTYKIEYYCDSCGSIVGPFEETSNSIENKVERFIHQKLRTGNWLSSKNT